jgi:hypothetical protein
MTSLRATAHAGVVMVVRKTPRHNAKKRLRFIIEGSWEIG